MNINKSDIFKLVGGIVIVSLLKKVAGEDIGKYLENLSVQTKEPETPTVLAYSDAVRHIYNSRMTDFYKQEAMSILQRHECEDYYYAFSAVVDSDTNDYYKLESLKVLNKKH